MKQLFKPFLVLMCLSAQPVLGQEIPKLNIGVVMPLSGSQRAFGQESLRGIEIAQEYFAKENPKVAARVSLSKHDDKSTAAEAAKLAEELYGKRRIHVIIGSISSPSTMEISKAAAKYRRPLISPLASNNELVKDGYVYRMGLVKGLQAELIAHFAQKELSIKRAAILRDESTPSKGAANRFKKAFGKVTSELSFPFGTTDFGQQLSQLKRQKVQAVFIPSSATYATRIIEQANQLGLKAIYLGTDGWDTPTLAKRAGKGHFFTAQFAKEKSNDQQQYFLSQFRARFGRDPGVVAALSFDSYLLAVDALQRARSTLHVALNRAFQRTEGFQGVTGLLSFQEGGNSLKSAFIKKTDTPETRLVSIISPSGLVARPPEK